MLNIEYEIEIVSLLGAHLSRIPVTKIRWESYEKLIPVQDYGSLIFLKYSILILYWRNNEQCFLLIQRYFLVGNSMKSLLLLLYIHNHMYKSIVFDIIYCNFVARLFPQFLQLELCVCN